MNSECYCCNQEISVVQGYILHKISELREPSMQQVADALDMDITTFSRQIKSLTEKGLVRKESLFEGRRVDILSLTEQGKDWNARSMTMSERTLIRYSPSLPISRKILLSVH